MFLFKKIVQPFFDPLSICLALLAIGLIALWFTKKQKLGKIFVSIGFIFLIIISCKLVAGQFIDPLESKYPALLKTGKLSGVKWIVVLGNGIADCRDMPPNSQLTNGSLVRLVEGIRIHQALPGTRIILSGGLGSHQISEAEAMARTAVFLGVDRRKLILDSKSKDTEEQAQMIKKMIGNDRFFLVTSASHMPRSVALARKLGLNPIPAPMDYKAKQGVTQLNAADFFPNSMNIMKIELAMHEYLGMVWARMKGRI